MKRASIWTAAALLAVWSMLSMGDSRAQDAPAPRDAEATQSDGATDSVESPEAADSTSAPSDLAGDEERIRQKFKHLEEVLDKMAEVMAQTDPRRAALLRRAEAQTKDQDIAARLGKVSEMLKKEQLSLGLKHEQDVHGDLKKLLDLLLSEDRNKRIESEKARLREYINRVNKLIKEQKGLQGDAAGEGDPKQLADAEGKLADKTGDLARDIQKTEGNNNSPDTPQHPKPNQGEKQPSKNPKPSDDKRPGDSKQPKPDQDGDAQGKPEGDQPSDQKGTDAKDDKESPSADKSGGDTKKNPDRKQRRDRQHRPNKKNEPKGPDQGKPDRAQPNQAEPSPSNPDQQPGQNQDSPSQPNKSPKFKPGQPGQPGQKQDQDQDPDDQAEQPPPQDNPVQRRIEQAEQRMKEARQKLDDARRQDATDKEQEAIKELEQAKAQLEEILRQLREEEIGRTLTLLEARFRKMLDMQVEVYEGTKLVAKIPPDAGDRSAEIEAGKLGRKEGEIAAEADRALAILHEEASAVAFPEAVADMREDMEQVARLLGETKVGEMTQGVEQEIIASLEEMITALQKAQKEHDKKKQKPRKSSPNGEPAEEPLVDNLAELKMIRALQMRVNLRTKRYADMLKNEQAEQPDILSALKQLAGREDRIHRVTRDIVVGRNQ